MFQLPFPSALLVHLHLLGLERFSILQHVIEHARNFMRRGDNRLLRAKPGAEQVTALSPIGNVEPDWATHWTLTGAGFVPTDSA